MRPKIVDNKFWLNSDGEAEEYFGFSGGEISSYYVKYRIGNKNDLRVIKYKLKPVKRGNLPFVRLSYPGNR